MSVALNGVGNRLRNSGSAAFRPRLLRRLDAFADWWFGGRRGWYVLVVALYLGAALAFTYPLILVAATHIPYKPAGDQLLLLSILEWQRTALLDQPGQFFTGNFYYGSGGALFASDLLLGLLPIFAPLAWLTDNPLLAYNLTHILAYALNALAMYAAALTLTRSRYGALAAGAVYAFGALQLTYASHLQLLAAWWLPLALLFALRFARSGSWRAFGLAALMVWAQFVTAVQLGVIAALVVLGYAGLPALWRIARRRDWRLALRLTGVTLLVSLPFIPIVLGYLAYSDAWRAERDITEVQFWSVQLRDFLSPGNRLRWFDALADRFPVPRGERRVFPGFVPPALAALGLSMALLGPRLTGRKLRYAALLAAALAALGVLFALGTHWKWREVTTDFELPYLWLFDHLSVFRAIRVVARFALLTHLALAVLAAIGVAGLARLASRRRFGAAAVALLATALVLVEAFPTGIPAYSVPEQAELAAALRQTPAGPALFVPVNRDEISRMWLVSRTGAGPLVNGYSGHIWQQFWYFRDATEKLSAADGPALAAGLQAYGVRNVVLYEPAIPGGDRRAWDAFAASAYVASVREAGAYTIITLRDPAAPPAGGWDALNIEFLTHGVSADAGFVGTLVFSNPSDRPWLPPDSSRVRGIAVVWTNREGRASLRFTTDVLPPPFLKPGQVFATTMHVFTPADLGAHRLTARADGRTILDQPVTVGLDPVEPFNGTGDGLLAALDLRTPASLLAQPAELLPLHVNALNVGRVGWTSEANIRLGWRWYALDGNGGEREVPKYEGRVPLLGHLYGDIPPGTGYAFAGRLRAPDEPGQYVVRVSLLSELVAWFGNDPLELRVTVTPPD